ncbi:ABC transporter permease [Streptomonospora sp. PA3]|uniref:ABC transporter permease n=1 Tax=Streptomonospora sp. PA3 TaxID=2607326 RepID=UPI0012DE8EBD|nr:ABC transporter permease [Streptomonospora sp. PA3]MUL42653.1 ABC transporter permease [Streptomonospora sp. PA3]
MGLNLPLKRRPGPADEPGGAADPATADAIAAASQWRLIWLRFRRHKLAMGSLAVVCVMALIGLFCEFVAPTTPGEYSAEHTHAPPQALHFVDTSGGGLDLGFYVYGYDSTRDQETLAREYTVDESEKVELGFFVEGTPYEMWGVIPADTHLFGPENPEDRMYLLGADRNGRDMLSRIVYGTRVSLSIGLVGVALAFVLGVVLGGASGYFGGRVDTAIQRVIEFTMSIPTIPLWMGLSAAVPREWGPLTTYFAITVILSLIGWTDLARVVRGRFLSLREEDFVLAARLDGCSRSRIIGRHMLPSFTSHIVASLTLAIPLMILAESALSFLGLGLQPPVVSWGVLMQEAQNIHSIAGAPWTLLPGVAVTVAVLALNFVGDGIRDSADPYQ